VRARGKSHALEVHSRRRVLERYGVTLTRALVEDIIRQIRDGRGRFVEKQSVRLSVWDVLLVQKGEDDVVNERIARVVYDKTRGQLVTAIPPETCGLGDWKEREHGTEG